MKKIENNLKEINRGEIYYLKKLSTFVLIISNKMHNFFSNYLTAILVVNKNADKVRESLEVGFELEKEKMKAIICCFHTINKQQIYEQGILVGQVNQKVLEKINEKIKSVLDLNE